MAKLVAENHLALHSIAEEVTPEDFQSGAVAKIVKKMRDALHAYSVEGYVGVAIAAPQIGISKRIFVVEDQSTDREGELPYLVAINPKIVKVSKRTAVVGEGCLSVRDRYGAVRRHSNVTLKALNENGEVFERGAGGLLAQIFQHECDHLDGTLFVDRAEKIWTKKETKKLTLHEAE